MIAYEDLDLRLLADGQGYVVSARRGTQSESEPFALDLSRSLDLEQLDALGPGGPAAARELGAALFDALIRGKVRDLYQQGRGAAGADTAKGLRIRIHFDSRQERLRPLLRLPWELLFDRSADAGGQLALDPRRPIVRMLDVSEPTVPPPSGPLKSVLLVLSNPSGLEPLDLETECAKVKEALGRIPIRPNVLRQVTRSRLQKSIGDGEHQIVHFMGHGTFDPGTGEGVLMLEDERSGSDRLPASDFAPFFAGRAMPRLVVLASCLSAEPGRDPACGPFASVAAALVAAGLPAVIAMQTKVRSRSAIRFTERLYERLAQGDPVEAAVSRARNALHAGRAGTLDWVVPVLFVRGQSEEVLDESEAAALKPPSLADPGDSSVNVGVSQRDVTHQEIYGYVRNLNRGGEAGKK